MLSADDMTRAAHALSTERQTLLSLEEVTELRASRVARCSVAGGPVDGETVIVKVADRTADSPRGLASIQTEHGALTFLREIGSSPAARLLAADPESGVLVLEDLGNAPSLAHVLLYGQRAAAEQACVAAATWLGGLHAETVGKSEHHDDVRERFGLPTHAADRFTLRGRDLRDCLKTLSEQLTSHALPDVGSWRELRTVVAELASPGDFLALSTGDPCPGNEAVLATGVRGFDLEAAAFRHALVDAAHYAIPFPNCWCWRRLPTEISESMLRAHRAQLAASSSQAADLDRYLEGLTRAMAAWVVWTLDRRLPQLDRDKHAAIRVIEAIDNFVRHSRLHQDLRALADDFEAIAEVLRSREAVSATPTYPAFGGPMWLGA